MTEATDTSIDSGRWYDLFARGTRDWLRHNEKVRAAVRERLAELATEPGVLSGDAERRVQVPVRFLEHYRFRLRQPNEEQGVGQGEGEPGDVLRPAQPGDAEEKGSGGQDEGGLQFVLEFEADELIDWFKSRPRWGYVMRLRGDTEIHGTAAPLGCQVRKLQLRRGQRRRRDRLRVECRQAAESTA